MKEIKDHIAYELLKTEYERVSLDYVILSFEGEETGIETHKKAVIEAFEILNERFSEFDYSVKVEPEKMSFEKCRIEELLSVSDELKEVVKTGEKSFSIPEPLSYSFAFLMPPYGTGLKEDDFIRFNDVLFPDKEDLEAYRFSDDFSDYFDAGKEWWGTGLWTVLDRKKKIITVIAASLTD
ncbi:MAG: hypothetical protein MJ171_08555 [Clostridia bacterium]|nr:hypothetical protein [Clostridia bacterium]